MSELMNAIYNKDKEYILNLFSNILNEYLKANHLVNLFGFYESVFDNNFFEFNSIIENNLYYDLFKMLHDFEFNKIRMINNNLLFDDKIILYLSLKIHPDKYDGFIIKNLKRIKNEISFCKLSYHYHQNNISKFYAKKSIKLCINMLRNKYNNNKLKYYNKYYLNHLKKMKYDFYLFNFLTHKIDKSYKFTAVYYIPQNLKIYIKIVIIYIL